MKVIYKIIIVFLSVFFVPSSNAESSWQFSVKTGLNRFFDEVVFMKGYTAPNPKEYDYRIWFIYSCGYGGSDVRDYYNSSYKDPYFVLSGHDVNFYLGDGKTPLNMFGYNNGRIGDKTQIQKIISQKNIIVEDQNTKKRVKVNVEELPDLISKHNSEIQDCYHKFEKIEEDRLFYNIRFYGSWVVGVFVFVFVFWIVFIRKFKNKTLVSIAFQRVIRLREAFKKRRFEKKIAKRTQELEVEEAAKKKFKASHKK